MRETARDHTPMTALPYYHVAARAVPAITATPCGGYPGVRLDFFGVFEARPGWPCALPRWPSSRRHRSEKQPMRLGRGMPVQIDRSAGTVVVRRPFFERDP